MPASVMHWLHGAAMRSMRSVTRPSSCADPASSGGGRVRRRSTPERKVDVRFFDVGQLALGLLGSPLEALHGHSVTVDIDAGCVLELLEQILDDARIGVLATEEGVAVGRLDDEDACPTPGWRYRRFRRRGRTWRCARARPIPGERRSGRLVDDPESSRLAMRPASLVAWRCESLK